jgi:hypothetical protein
MVLYKAGKNNPQIKKWGLAFQIPTAFGISGVLAILFYFIVGPFLERRITAKFERLAAEADVELNAANEEPTVDKGIDSTEKTKAGDVDNGEGENMDQKPKAKKSIGNVLGGSMRKMAASTINRDIEAEGEKNCCGQAYLSQTLSFPNTTLTPHTPLAPCYLTATACDY